MGLVSPHLKHQRVKDQTVRFVQQFGTDNKILQNKCLQNLHDLLIDSCGVSKVSG